MAGPPQGPRSHGLPARRAGWFIRWTGCLSGFMPPIPTEPLWPFPRSTSAVRDDRGAGPCSLAGRRGSTGARGFIARSPWRRRASPVRPVGSAPDGGEEPHAVKQMITAAPGRGPPHRARRALPALTSENGLWPLNLADPGAFTAGARYRRSREGQGTPGNRSGRDLQCHQPFELADFLAKTMHAGAVDSLRPHGGGEIAMPGGPVPVFTIERAVRY